MDRESMKFWALLALALLLGLALVFTSKPSNAQVPLSESIIGHRDLPSPTMRDTFPDWPDTNVPCDTSAVQGALNTASPEMDLVLPSGCALRGPLRIDRSDIVLRGHPDGTSSLWMGPDDPAQIPPAEGYRDVGIRVGNVSRVGIEDLTLWHSTPMAVRAFNSAIEMPDCDECWVDRITCDRWGNSCIDTSANGFSSTTSLSIHSSNFIGQDYRMRCAMPVVGQGTFEGENGIEARTVTFRTNGECRAWNDGTFSPEGLIGLPNEGPMVFQILEETSSEITLALRDATTNQPFMGDITSTWGVQLNKWGIAKIYCAGQSVDVQLVNSIFDNVRVAAILQNGCPQFTAFGNYGITDSHAHGDRSLFLHGGGHRDAPDGFRGGEYDLLERNDFDTAYVPYAEAAQGLGIGPGFTMLNNRGRRKVNNHHALADRGGGSIDLERNDQMGVLSIGHTIAQNFLVGVNGGPIDSCDGNDDRSCSSGEMPQLVDLFWANNLLEGSGDNVLEGERNPTTTHRGFTDKAHNANEVPGKWSRRDDWAITVAYARELEADPNFRPPWWCDEAVPFTSIPMKVDSRVPSPWAEFKQTKLPAQIRHEGGDCTLPQ